MLHHPRACSILIRYSVVGWRRTVPLFLSGTCNFGGMCWEDKVEGQGTARIVYGFNSKKKQGWNILRARNLWKTDVSSLQTIVEKRKRIIYNAAWPPGRGSLLSNLDTFIYISSFFPLFEQEGEKEKAIWRWLYSCRSIGLMIFHPPQCAMGCRTQCIHIYYHLLLPAPYLPLRLPGIGPLWNATHRAAPPSNGS